MSLSIRLAAAEDVPALEPLVDVSIDRNQRAFLTPDEIASSRAIMGVDHQLIEDDTYYVGDVTGRCSIPRATPPGSERCIRTRTSRGAASGGSS